MVWGWTTGGSQTWCESTTRDGETGLVPWGSSGSVDVLEVLGMRAELGRHLRCNGSLSFQGARAEGAQRNGRSRPETRPAAVRQPSLSSPTKKSSAPLASLIPLVCRNHPLPLDISSFRHHLIYTTNTEAAPSSHKHICWFEFMSWQVSGCSYG